MKGIKKPKVANVYGKLTPWVWSVELVRGCNLACFHCTARLFGFNSKPVHMSMEDVRHMAKVMAEQTPGKRLEFAQGGEPTLHPQILEVLREVRRISPTTQIQVTTNGLTMIKGQYTFRDFFEAGANSVYVDMYAPRERFIEMAKEAHEQNGGDANPAASWYYYNDPKIGSPGHRYANTFYGDTDKMRLIILQDNPHNRIVWRKMGRLSTFLNHLDWKASMPFGLVPVREPYQRKCTLPQRYVSLSYTGHYLFCCIDFECESAGKIGHVSEGSEGFKKYWLGEFMGEIRRRLRTGDRKDIPYCSRCNCAFSKCDWVKIWPDRAVEEYWDGEKMVPMPERVARPAIFKEAWEYTDRLQAALPSVEEEKAALEKSKAKLIIKSSAAVDRDARRAAGIYDTEDTADPRMMKEARKGKFHGIEKGWAEAPEDTGPLASQRQLFEEEPDACACGKKKGSGCC